MKTIKFLLLMVLVSSCITTKPILLSYKDYTIEKEISCNKNADDLYVIANGWMVETFNNASSVIQFADKEAGIIKGRYLMGGGMVSDIDRRVFAIITVQVKDNLTKITVAPQGEANYYPPTSASAFWNGSMTPSGEEIKAKGDQIVKEYEIYIANYKKW